MDFRRLKALDLSKTRITDSGLVELRGLKGLLELNLSGTRITDAGLAPVWPLEPSCA